MPNPSELQRDREDPPPPGSDAAIAAGCTCPCLDNRRGMGWNVAGEFVIAADCPLHGAKGGADAS